MRMLFVALLLAPASAAAWEFRPDPICTLSHDTVQASLRITYNPAVPEYGLRLDLNLEDWAEAQTFGMAFSGARALTIGTSRHRTAGRTLTVTDRGFGNVLDGLEFNRTARAFTDTQSVAFGLEGAAAPVREFRRCTEMAPPVS